MNRITTHGRGAERRRPDLRSFHVLRSMAEKFGLRSKKARRNGDQSENALVAAAVAKAKRSQQPEFRLGDPNALWAATAAPRRRNDGKRGQGRFPQHVESN